MLFRTKIGSALFILIGSVTTTAAQAQDKLVELVENICIGGRLDEDLLKPMIVTAGEVFDMEVRDIPLSVLRQGSPDSTSGWGLVGEGEAYIFVFAHKKDGANVSRSCAVTTQGTDGKNVASYFELNFRSRKMLSETQGASQVTAYELDLIGFPDKHYLSIQAMAAASLSESLVVVAFYEIPR